MVANFQCEKKRLDDLKKLLKQTTTLEGELKMKGKQLTTFAKKLTATNAELSKKWGEVIDLRQVAQGPIY